MRVDPISKLLDGFQRFREQYFLNEPGLFTQLASGQSPAVAVVACCDSRVDPAIIMDCKPGDLFIIRNVANLVPPYEPDGLHHGTSAALEFAVCALKVQHIIVLGHAQCGGIQALLNVRHAGDFIASWMSIADAAREQTLGNTTLKTPREQVRHCEQAAIRASLKNLLTFPWIKERLDDATLHLHGWYFDIESGELLRYDETRDIFAPQVVSSEGVRPANPVSGHTGR